MTTTAPAAVPGTLTPPRSPALDETGRAIYRSLVEGEYAAGSAGRVTFCVYTSNLEEGRGDIYVAAGLARALVARGWGVRFVPKAAWRTAGEDTDLVVAMLESFDPGAVPSDVPLIGWVRNQTRVWARAPQLVEYDGVLASSSASLAEIRQRFAGPTELLPIGVDTGLFRPTEGSGPRAGLTTSVNNWGTDRDLHRAVAASRKPLPLVWFGEQVRVSTAIRRYFAGPVSYFALPDTYRRSLVVLDDMNHTTLPFGNVNSRLYEALACGALPVTNGAIGLAELGLEEVPVYRTAEELSDIIERLLADPAGTAALAARLRDITVRQHSFETRAMQFLQFLPQAQEHAARKRPTVTYFPDYADNPYQRLLYAETVAAGARVAPTAVPGRISRDTGGDLTDRILHVQWTAPIIQYAPGLHTAWRKFEQFRHAVLDVKSRGGTVLWTIHNLLPHDPRHRTVEIELHRFLAEAADVIHVLGEETAPTAATLYHLDPDKIRVIEHCSYEGVYPDWVGRDEARRRVGLLEQEIALLLLGEIRPYKGLDLLLPAFEAAAQEEPRLRLLIAGRPGKHGTVQPLLEQCRQHPRITTSFDYVPDADIQVWMRAADIAVLPYRSTLNSGALLLAQTFGRPVIAPASGVVGGQLDPEHSVAFRAGDRDSLSGAISEAVRRLVTEEATISAAAAAQRRPPSAMSAAFLALVQELIPEAGWAEPASASSTRRPG